MQVWNVLRVARWKCRTQKSPKSRHLRTIVQLCQAISLQLRHLLTIVKKNLLNSNISSTCPHNMVNFGLLSTEIVSLIYGTAANFNVLAALLHITVVVAQWVWTKLCMKYLGEILNGSILNGSSGLYSVYKNQVLFDSSKLLTLVWLCGRLVGSHVNAINTSDLHWHCRLFFSSFSSSEFNI